MFIQGNFINRRGQNIFVQFYIVSATGDDVIIGSDKGDGHAVWFAADDAVTVDTSFNDQMDVIICRSATVSLMCESYLPELFSRGFADVRVTIWADGVKVFTGFVDPDTYQQPFTEAIEPLDVNCIDCLSALQYVNFRHVGQSNTYDSAYSNAGTSTFKALITEALAAVALPQTRLTIWYDYSRALAAHDPQTVFQDISVSDVHFLTDSEDNTASYQTVIEDCLKYLNLHIMQWGDDFYIFSWEFVQCGKVVWHNLLTGSAVADLIAAEEPETVTLDNTAGDSTQVTQMEAFNRIVLKISPETVDTLVESPFDSPEPIYPHRQLYLTEYRSKSKNDCIRFVMGDITQQQGVPYYCDLGASAMGNTEYHAGIPSGKWISYFIQLMGHKHWKFGTGGESLAAHLGMEYGKNQQFFLNRLASMSDGTFRTVKNSDGTTTGSYAGPASVNAAFEPAALMVKTSKAVINGDSNDSAMPTSLTDETAVIIAIGGKGSVADKFPNDKTFLDYAPLITYKGVNAAVFSPADSSTHNYFVIDGKITLCPSRWNNGGSDARDHWQASSAYDPIAPARTLYKAGRPMYFAQSRDNDHDRRILYDWYKAEDCHDDAVEDTNPTGSDSADGSTGFMPFAKDDDYVSDRFVYNYAQPHDGKDRIQFLSVLCCMLVIGDGAARKCLVTVDQEKVFDQLSGVTDPAGRYQTVGTFKWQTFKSLEQCRNDHPADENAALDEYYAQTFAIGIDPKIGDNIMGKEFDIATNFDFRLGIDATKGLAVPLPHEDNLHGSVSFQILGPYEQMMWNHITRRHKTWFRREKWRNDAFRLFDYVDYIKLSEFSMKLYTDTSESDSTEKQDTGGGDIIYMSDTDESFYNKKDVQFNIHSAFTSQECAELGVQPVIAMSTTVDTATGQGVLRITDKTTNQTEKPEKLYVDAYWQELHLPRCEVQHEFYFRPQGALHFPIKNFQALGKNFYTVARRLNLADGTEEDTLIETRVNG